ncbi:unnamed protein product [Protopolystoma xenopodis]|uniref:Uncharacterized protein n=1 Tax=Protopolystoma xenopodis TaxID=117903 RepID=A0A3S5A4M6_9PLAT|nr:unnamed protein product [Protopolystoma xenopodis]
MLASSAVTGGLKSEENLPHPRRLIKRQHPLRPTQRARDPYSRNRHRTSRPNDRIGFDRTAPKQSSSPFFSAASGSDINRLIKQPHLDSQPLLPGMLFSTNRLKRSSHSGTKEMASGMIKRAKILGTVRLKPDDENNKIDKMVTADKNGAIDEWVVNDMSAGRVGGKSAFSIIPVSQVPHVHQSSDPHRIHRNIASSSSSSSISLVALRRLYGLMLFTRSQRCQMLTQAASLALSQIIPQSPSLQELTHPSSSQ